MQTDTRLSVIRKFGSAIAAVVALTAMQAAAASDHPANDQYTWSAELVSIDAQAGTATVQCALVSDADVDFAALASGEPVTLTWSGINTAAGIRHITKGSAPADDRLTLPIEFVSAEHDGRYARFKVRVPSDDLAKLAALPAGAWITATSPRRAGNKEEAVADMRPYNDVG